MKNEKNMPKTGKRAAERFAGRFSREDRGSRSEEDGLRKIEKIEED